MKDPIKVSVLGGWALRSAASPLRGVGDPHVCLCGSHEAVKLSMYPQVPG